MKIEFEYERQPYTLTDEHTDPRYRGRTVLVGPTGEVYGARGEIRPYVRAAHVVAEAFYGRKLTPQESEFVIPFGMGVEARRQPQADPQPPATLQPAELTTAPGVELHFSATPAADYPEVTR